MKRKVRERCAEEDQRIPRAADPVNARENVRASSRARKMDEERCHFLVISRSIALLAR